MADFGTILKPDNYSLDLYCNSIIENVNAYAILGTVNTSQTVLPATPQLVNWGNTLDRIVYNIGEPNGTSFNLIKSGVYLIDFSISVDLPPTDAGQAQATLVVDGLNKGFDVAFSSVFQGAIGGAKLLLKGYATKLVSNPNPVNVSIRLSTIGPNFLYRYAQISITRVG